MTTRTTINNALTARGLLPMDGDCTCASCGMAGFNRADMDSGFCRECLDDAAGWAVIHPDADRKDDPHDYKTHYDADRGCMVPK